MAAEKHQKIPGESSGLVVMTRDDLISALREAFPHLAAANSAELEYLTKEQVAEILDVEPRTVSNYVSTEGLPAKRLGKNGLRFKRADVIAWLDARAAKPGAHVDRHITRLKGATK